MSEEFQLLFRVQQTGAEDLNQKLHDMYAKGMSAKEALSSLGGSIDKVGTGSKAAAHAVDQQTRSLGQLQSQAASMDRTAQQLTGTMSRGMGMTEARYSAQLLSQELGMHLPRAITSLIAHTGSLGTAMKALLPIGVGLFAVESVIRFGSELKKLYDDYVLLKGAQESMRDSGKSIWEGMKSDIDATNSALEKYIRLTKGAPAADRFAMGVSSQALYQPPGMPSEKDKQFAKLNPDTRQSILSMYSELPVSQINDRLAQIRSRRDDIKEQLPLAGTVFGPYSSGNLQVEDTYLSQLESAYVQRQQRVAAERVAAQAQLKRDQQREALPGERYADALGRARGTAELEGLSPQMRAIQEAMNRRSGWVERYGKTNPGASADAQSMYMTDIHGIMSGIIRHGQGELLHEPKQYEDMMERSQGDRNYLFSQGLRGQMEDGRGVSELYKQMVGLGANEEVGTVQRQFGLASSLRGISGNDNPITAYAAQMQMATQIASIREDSASKEVDDTTKVLDLTKALYDTIRSGDEAHAQQVEEIARIGQQQQDEGAHIISGGVMAALSGNGGAYWRGQGRGIFEHIVTNTAGTMLGPGGLNNYAGLGSSGLLGSPDHRSVMGKMLQGTPFDFSSKDLQKAAAREANQPLIESQGRLVSSIDALTGALGGAPPMHTSGGAGGSIPGASSIGLGGLNMGSIGSVAHAIQSGSPGSILRSVGGIFTGGGNGANAMPFTGSLPRVLAPTGVSSTFSSGLNPGAPPNIQGEGQFDHASTDALVAHLYGGAAPPTRDANAIQRFAGGLGSTVSNMFGNVGNGQAYNAIRYGGVVGPNGAESITGGQRLATGVGAGIAAAGGAYTAYNQFSKGGARGIMGGLGATAGTVAMFDPDPFSRGILEAASMGLGLVSALMPDPRAERIKQEQQRLTANAYIRPAQREYSFGSSEGGGGFQTGMNGSMRAGGPSSNYTIHFSPNALSAKSFTEWMKENPQEAGQALMTGVSDSAIAGINSQIAWASSNGGYVPPGGLGSSG